ncbi:MAG: NAD-dependent epimerase/dehydratase family protein [Alphaproteobacteria bacterium]|nr:NAD-dependent epimerase/dehydratase family protein [Alphaproteobacteria bacterium]
MKILITGANGYIGQHVVDKALQKNHEVVCVDLMPFSNNKIQSIKMNFLEKAGDPSLYNILGSPDVIIHMAWQDGFNHQSDAHLRNLHSHYAFIKNMIDAGCKSISIMGTMHEIGYHEGSIDENTPCNPLSLYGIAKNALRQSILTYIENKDVSLKWLRAFYITGDDNRNKSIFAKILQMSKEGKTSFPFTSGINKYDFIDVNLLAEQIVKASTQVNISGIINCCSGNAVSLKDKVEEFIKTHNLNITPEYGAYPTRKYDSPAVWGDATIIKGIMDNE